MKNKIYLFIIIIILLIGIIIMWKNIKQNKKNINQSVKHISMEQAEKLIKKEKDYIILDVRTIEEYNSGHIPNAICIPNEEINEFNVKKLSNKEQIIFVYCRSGNRSRQASKKLEKLGYKNIIEIGGITSWKGPIVKN